MLTTVRATCIKIMLLFYSNDYFKYIVITPGYDNCKECIQLVHELC